MSIANEISRIRNAKTSLQNVMQNRGVSVGDDVLLSDYPQLLEGLPYVLKGSFTPEEDVNSFELSGLDFAPEAVLISCSDLSIELVAGGIFATYLYKDEQSAVLYSVYGTTITFAKIGPKSSMIVWSDQSVQLTIPASSATTFKKGYTYNYIVAGGKPQ